MIDLRRPRQRSFGEGFIEEETASLLMQDAPADLYAAAREQLLDPAKYGPAEIARRERALGDAIALLHAPLHPNCYLSYEEFAEKFGLDDEVPEPAEALVLEQESLVMDLTGERIEDLPLAQPAELPVAQPKEQAAAQPEGRAEEPVKKADKPTSAGGGKADDEYFLAMLSALKSNKPR